MNWKRVGACLKGMFRFWETYLYFGVFVGAFLAPYLLFSQTPDAYFETMASLIAEEAASSEGAKLMNGNFVYLGEATRSGLSSLCTEASVNTNYEVANEGFNARVVYNSNIEPFYEVDSFEEQAQSVLVSNVFSNHLNPKGAVIFDVFEFELMFPESNTNYSGYDNFVYIRHADHLIAMSDGVFDSYESLIGYALPVRYVFEGASEERKWKVANILVEENDTNEVLLDTIGPYMLAYINLPGFSRYSYNIDYSTSNARTEAALKTQLDRFGGGEYSFQVTRRGVSDNSSRIDLIEGMMMNGKGVYPISVPAAVGLSVLCFAFPLGALFLLGKVSGYRSWRPYLSLFTIVIAIVVYSAWAAWCASSALLTPYFLSSSIVTSLLCSLLVVLLSLLLPLERPLEEMHS